MQRTIGIQSTYVFIHPIVHQISEHMSQKLFMGVVFINSCRELVREYGN